MDTSYYRNFLTLVQIGNITEAAEALHITQPALSKQIKLLEAHFGTQLIISKRGQKGITITDAGRIFVEQIQQVCNYEVAAREAVKRMTAVIDGTLRIGVANSRAVPLVQQILQYFYVEYPSVTFEIYEGTIKEITEQLKNGVIEIALCSDQLLPYNTFDVLASTREELYAIYRNDIYFAGMDKEALTIERLKHLPLSLSSESLKMIIQNQPDVIADLDIVSVSTTKSVAIEWAASGKSVAFVPMEIHEQVNRYQVSRAMIRIPDCTFEKVLIKNRGQELSSVAQHFIEFYNKMIL